MGYLNIDQYVSKPDIIRMNIFELKFDDNSVDEIFTEHMLEHLGKYEVPIALKEWARVLKPEGKLIMNLPNLEWCMREWLNRPESERWGFLLDTIFGLQTHPGEFHKTGFTEQRLRQLLAYTGFKYVSIRESWSHYQSCFWVEASKELANLDNDRINLGKERRRLTEFWVNIPSSQLEAAYHGDMGNLQRKLIETNIRNETLSEEEKMLFQHLNAELTRRSSVDPASAMNYLLAIMLYLPSGRLRIENAETSLPPWLVDDYKKFFESGK